MHVADKYLTEAVPAMNNKINDLLTSYYNQSPSEKRFADKSVLDTYRQAIDGDINTSDEGKAVNIFADTVLMEKGINGNGKNGKR